MPPILNVIGVQNGHNTVGASVLCQQSIEKVDLKRGLTHMPKTLKMRAATS